MKANDGSEPWPWPDSLDGILAAPLSHQVVLENDRVRVLDVVIESGAKEPPHTHKLPGVFIVIAPTRLRYFGAAGELVREYMAPTEPRWFGPEPLHAVENIDSTRYRAIRIELKDNSN